MIKYISICIAIYIVSMAVIIGLVILLHRYFSHRELDDVHPRIMDISNPTLQASKWIWVIPLYMNDPVSNYPDWVDRLKKSGKKIGLHGVRHVHKEFEQDLSEEYMNEGILEFHKAFGFYPTHFKAPSLALSKSNRTYLRNLGIQIMGRYNQVMHIVYHTDDHRDVDGKLIGEY